MYRSAVLAALATPSLGYFLGETLEDGRDIFQKCWQQGNLMVACPTDFKMNWDLYDIWNETSPFIDGEERKINLNFTWKSNTDNFVVHQNDAVTNIIPHINLHACKVEEGACVPFMGSNGGTITHAPASKGNVMGVYESTIALTEGTWTIIGHGRAYLNDTTSYPLVASGCEQVNNTQFPWKMDVAIGAQVTVLPKPRQLLVVEDMLLASGLMVNVVLFMILLILLGWLVFMKDHVVVKSAAIVTLCTGVLGAVIIVASAIVTAMAFDNEMIRCYALPAVFSIGFWLTFGMFGMKTWRINQIFLKSIELEEFSMSNSTLLMWVCAPIIVDLAVLGVWFLADAPHMSREIDLVNAAADSMQCMMGNEELWTFFVVFPKFCVLVHIAQIAYKVKDVPDNFNESKGIMLGLCSSTILFTVFTIFGVAMKLPVDQRFVSCVIGIPLAFVVPNAIIICSKMWNIYVTKDFENEEKNDIIKFITNAKSKATGMSSQAESDMSGMSFNSEMDSGMSGMSAVGEEVNEEILALEAERERLLAEVDKIAE